MFGTRLNFKLDSEVDYMGHEAATLYDCEAQMPFRRRARLRVGSYHVAAQLTAKNAPSVANGMFNGAVAGRYTATES